jgi:hypothetical protein
MSSIATEGNEPASAGVLDVAESRHMPRLADPL